MDQGRGPYDAIRGILVREDGSLRLERDFWNAISGVIGMTFRRIAATMSRM